MATNTTNLNLTKPSPEDFYNVNDFNENFQKIDDFIGRKDNPHGVTTEQIGALSDKGGVLTGPLYFSVGEHTAVVGIDPNNNNIHIIHQKGQIMQSFAISGNGLLWAESADGGQKWITERVLHTGNMHLITAVIPATVE